MGFLLTYLGITKAQAILFGAGVIFCARFKDSGDSKSGPSTVQIEMSPYERIKLGEYLKK